MAETKGNMKQLHLLTQEQVDTLIKAHSAPIREKLTDLAMVIQNLTQNPPSRTNLTTSSPTFCLSRDVVRYPLSGTTREQLKSLL